MDARSWRRGVLAGVLGTGVVSGAEALRDRWLGHAAPYAARRIGARLAWRLARVRLHPAQARRVGRLLRYTYGPALGVACAGVAWRTRRWPLALEALATGGALFALEWVGLPAVGATPPTRTWSRAERGALLAQTLAFGLVVGLVLRRPHGAIRPAA